MRLRKIASSHLSAAGYDEKKKILSVQFEGGEIYDYFDVPPAVYQEMLDAQPHPWTAVNRQLRNGFDYRRRS